MSGWTEKDLAEWANSHKPGTLEPKSEDPRVVVPKSRMNKWEAQYDAELRVKWGAGIIQWYGFEAVKLRLADNAHYTPDFAVMDAGRLEFHEVKGFWRDDALVKFKVAAAQFPFLFLAYRKKKVSEGGGWEMIRALDGRRK